MEHVLFCNKNNYNENYLKKLMKHAEENILYKVRKDIKKSCIEIVLPIFDQKHVAPNLSHTWVNLLRMSLL